MTASSDHGRSRVEIGGDVRLCILAQAALEIDALAPLMIDLLTVVFERRLRSRALVRERDRVVAVQHGRANQDRRIDRRHRNMAVPGAQLVVLEQLRRELALNIEQRQAGALGAGGDQSGVADPDGGHRLVHAFERLDRDQRILAAADGDERAAGKVQALSFSPREKVARSAG